MRLVMFDFIWRPSRRKLFPKVVIPMQGELAVVLKPFALNVLRRMLQLCVFSPFEERVGQAVPAERIQTHS